MKAVLSSNNDVRFYLAQELIFTAQRVSARDLKLGVSLGGKRKTIIIEGFIYLFISAGMQC